MESKDPLASSTGVNSTAANPAGYVSISDEEATREVISNVIGGLWEAVNELTRLRPDRRERYHVSIFGSARIKPDNLYGDASSRITLTTVRCGTWPGPSQIWIAISSPAVVPA